MAEKSSSRDYAEGYSSEIQERLKNAVHYYQWIYRTVKPFLGARVLEVGCGGGHFTRLLLDRERVVSTDISKIYVEEVAGRHKNLENFSAFVFDILDPSLLSLSSEQFDTVVCLNVLEHIEDDATALSHIGSVLAPGGRLILLVPALKWLYGEMDRADRHFRRYTKKELSCKLSDASFTLEKMLYFNFLGTFGWFLNGRILKRKLLPENQLGAFDRLVPFLAAVESVVPIPFGQSLIAIARREKEPLNG
ncbi:MAG: class I SAM-dependent methyltransferase [Candidatus Omnitrophica bacterium]|nr:class I SAM-dependent methyltransferase [Candidatus Omnitrophota bacterium]